MVWKGCPGNGSPFPTFLILHHFFYCLRSSFIKKNFTFFLSGHYAEDAPSLIFDTDEPDMWGLGYDKRRVSVSLKVSQ